RTAALRRSASRDALVAALGGHDDVGWARDDDVERVAGDAVEADRHVGVVPAVRVRGWRAGGEHQGLRKREPRDLRLVVTCLVPELAVHMYDVGVRYTEQRIADQDVIERLGVPLEDVRVSLVRGQC